MAEVDLTIEDGTLLFSLLLMGPQELLATPSQLRYVDVDGQAQQLDLPAGSIGYTFCQVPIA